MAHENFDIYLSFKLAKNEQVNILQSRIQLPFFATQTDKPK